MFRKEGPQAASVSVGGTVASRGVCYGVLVLWVVEYGILAQGVGGGGGLEGETERVGA